VGWKSLAVGAEINVIADGTLVANPIDIALGGLVFAQRSITEDAIMDLPIMSLLLGEGFIDWGKSVPGVTLGSIYDAVWTVVPIRAIKTLVAGANNVLGPR
jgi:hypothetical protein